MSEHLTDEDSQFHRDFLAEMEQRRQTYGPDEVEGCWELGLTVWADHCVKCGRWAKVLACSYGGDWKSWRVTECAQCGIHDSRE